MAKKDATSTRYNIDNKIRQMLKELTAEEGASLSATVERAIREMYDRDTVDENIILARQATLERKMGYLDKKIETMAGLFIYTLPLLFAGLSQLPKD